MFRIVRKRIVAERTKEIVVAAPELAAHAQAGQFVILRNSTLGERYPLTIADFDAAAGTITLVFLEIGKSTIELGRLGIGEAIPDLVGPLGNPTRIEQVGRIVCVGGGVGIAAAHPVARAFREAGNRVTSIIGARTASLLFYEDEMRAVSDDVIVTTDDGSRGAKGLVTERLTEVMNGAGPSAIGEVFAVGPSVMMRAVAATTRPHKIRTTVSLNPIMVDGTGMCGGCRVEVGSETKFACVDGPDFDAHLVDFDLLIARQKMYREHESRAVETCKLNKRLASREEEPNGQHPAP